jgi:uncharacterized membrane protein
MRKEDKMDVSKYNKFLVALGVAVSTGIAFAADGEFSLNDAVGTVVALLGALGVYRVPNTPE